MCSCPEQVMLSIGKLNQSLLCDGNVLSGICQPRHMWMPAEVGEMLSKAMTFVWVVPGKKAERYRKMA